MTSSSSFFITIYGRTLTNLPLGNFFFLILERKEKWETIFVGCHECSPSSLPSSRDLIPRQLIFASSPLFRLFPFWPVLRSWNVFGKHHGNVWTVILAGFAVCAFVYNSAKNPNGTFASPNWPGLYPRETECHYFFYGQSNERVHITFAYFDIEGVPP